MLVLFMRDEVVVWVIGLKYMEECVRDVQFHHWYFLSLWVVHYVRQVRWCETICSSVPNATLQRWERKGNQELRKGLIVPTSKLQPKRKNLSLTFSSSAHRLASSRMKDSRSWEKQEATSTTVYVWKEKITRWISQSLICQ